MAADFLPRKPHYVRVRIDKYTLTFHTFDRSLRRGDFVTPRDGALVGLVGIVKRRSLGRFGKRGYTFGVRRARPVV